MAEPLRPQSSSHPTTSEVSILFILSRLHANTVYITGWISRQISQVFPSKILINHTKTFTLQVCYSLPQYNAILAYTQYTNKWKLIIPCGAQSFCCYCTVNNLSQEAFSLVHLCCSSQSWLLTRPANGRSPTEGTGNLKHMVCHVHPPHCDMTWYLL